MSQRRESIDRRLKSSIVGDETVDDDVPLLIMPGRREKSVWTAVARLAASLARIRSFRDMGCEEAAPVVVAVSVGAAGDDDGAATRLCRARSDDEADAGRDESRPRLGREAHGIGAMRSSGKSSGHSSIQVGMLESCSCSCSCSRPRIRP